MRIISLVSCTAKKVDSRSPAKDLYISPWFQKARKWAEGLSREWFILSARHYLVHPATILDPYEYSLDDYLKDHPDLSAWVNMVVFGLLSELGLWGTPSHPTEYPYDNKNTVLVLMAGDKYRRELVPRLNQLGFAVYHPTPGMGIGEQLSYFSNTDPQSIIADLQNLLDNHKWEAWAPLPFVSAEPRRTHSPIKENP